jgi:short-subunit dehydrogenase
MNNNYALITGASTGIGYALAKVAAKNNFNLIIVARNKAKLEEVKAEIEEEFKVKVEVIAADLADPKSPKHIFDEVQRLDLKIQVLVNNAGFGSNGRFDLLPWENERDQLQVNVSSLMEMCHLFTPKLIEIGNGKILNVASIAGFIPGPYMATYYSTKAFVKSFSIALKEELKETGVSVSVLCPGATKSDFFERAKFAVEMSKKENAMMSAESVAEIGWSGLFKGKTVIISGLSNLIIISIVKHLPETLLAKGIQFFNKAK